MSFVKGISRRQRAEDVFSQSSLSELVSFWRDRFRRQEYRPRAGGQFFRAGGAFPHLGGPGPAVIRARAPDSVALDYSTDAEEDSTDYETVWSPKVIFALTAIMALFLIGSLAILLVNDGVISYRWSPEFEEDAVEAAGPGLKMPSPLTGAQADTAAPAPPSRWPRTHVVATGTTKTSSGPGPKISSSPAEDQAVPAALAPPNRLLVYSTTGTPVPVQRTTGTPSATEMSATTLSHVHHGPRFFGNRATSGFTQTATEAASATDEAAAETREFSSDNEKIVGRKQDACAVAVHVYCVKVRDEFYYQPSMNTCVMTATDRTVVCNHSRNKYLSHEHCRKSCVEGAVPSEKCFQTATFSMCTRRDVRHKWWFFNGSHCQPWDFPMGACPSHTDADGGDAFESYSECAQTCVQGHQPRLRRCQRPINEPCTAHQLRFPYFAVGVPTAGSGVFRCVKASGAVLAHHRCATGENRFHTRDACARRCYHEE